jgi:AcrR family transcriptional regulator
MMLTFINYLVKNITIGLIMSLKEKYIKRNPEETVRAILAAATKEFVEKGFAGARVDSIAKNSGSNKGMIYYYFKNKEGLYNAVLEQEFCKKEAMGSQNVQDIIETILDWADHCREELDFIRLMQWEALEKGNKKVLNEEARADIFRKEHQRIKELQKQGFLPAEVDVAMGHLLFMALNWFPYAFPQMTRMLLNMDSNSEEYHERHKKFLMFITEKLLKA